MYNEIKDLIVQMVFNGSTAETTYGDFMAEAIAAIATTIIIALPFIIVWRIIRRFL